MPIPTNTTPATAIAMTSPYTVTLVAADVELAPQGTGYAATCESDQHHALWWKYVAGASDTLFLFGAKVVGNLDYGPVVSVWTGTAPALTQLLVATLHFCYPTYGIKDGRYVRVPVTPGTTYYFQVTDGEHSGTVDADLVIRAQVGESLSSPTGSILITDDTPGFPGAVLAPADGSFRQWPLLPACEHGDFLASGVLCTSDNAASAESQAVLIDAVNGYTEITRVDFGVGAVVVAVGSNLVDTFYVLTSDFSTLTVHEVSAAGVIGRERILPTDSLVTQGFAVTLDGSIIYYGANEVHAYDLVNDVALADLHANFVGETLKAGRDGFVDADGNIWLGYRSLAGGTTRLRKFDATGTVLAAYEMGTATFDGLHHFKRDPDGLHVWCWSVSQSVLPTGQQSAFKKILMADGSTVVEWFVPDTTDSDLTGVADNPDAISDSCPILIVPVAIDVPIPTTTITYPLRFLRRFSLPFDGNVWHYLARLEFLIQSGVGLTSGQGSDPEMMVRFSKDGGTTWGTVYRVPMGKIGEYSARAVLHQLGRYRQGVCEIAITDPVFIGLLEANADLTKGMH